MMQQKDIKIDGTAVLKLAKGNKKNTLWACFDVLIDLIILQVIGRSTI
jgi:hypothetical protein